MYTLFIHHIYLNIYSYFYFPFIYSSFGTSESAQCYKAIRCFRHGTMVGAGKQRFADTVF